MINCIRLDKQTLNGKYIEEPFNMKEIHPAECTARCIVINYAIKEITFDINLDNFRSF